MNWLQKLLRGLVEGAGRPVPRIDVHASPGFAARDMRGGMLAWQAAWLPAEAGRWPAICR